MFIKIINKTDHWPEKLYKKETRKPICMWDKLSYDNHGNKTGKSLTNTICSGNVVEVWIYINMSEQIWQYSENSL